MKLKLFLCTLFAIGVFPLSAGLQLVQVVPGNNSQNVLITSKIVLVFSEDVVLGEGTCQLNGVTMQPTSVVSKYATFVPSGLEYSTPYTFQIAADAFRSKSGGQSFAGQEIAFVTEDAPKPQPKVYDAVVSADGSGQYASVQSAIDAAPTGRTTPWLIFIKKGRYNEHIVVPESKPHIHLIGQDRDETVITFPSMLVQPQPTGAIRRIGPVLYTTRHLLYTAKMGVWSTCMHPTFMQTTSPLTTIGVFRAKRDHRHLQCVPMPIGPSFIAVIFDRIRIRG